jgi:hypothetical protein
VRLHHDFEVLGSERIDPELRTLIAAGLVAEWLMRRHEGLPEDVDWATNHDAALGWLQVDAAELEHWQDALMPQLDSA